MYRENALRAELQKNFCDYQEYLRSLDMTAEILPFQSVYLSRIAQLTNKTNQFNLTTRRYSREELERISEDPACFTLYGKLSDRFGDNGIVSVVAARRREGKENEVDILLWLMSCRVLKRGMEDAMMDQFVDVVSRQGIRVIHGFYFPTSKNGMVKNFYADMGFTKGSEAEDGASEWILDVLHDYSARNHIIRVNKT